MKTIDNTDTDCRSQIKFYMRMNQNLKYFTSSLKGSWPTVM